MIKRLWWSWTLGVLLAASACGGASSEQRTDTYCDFTRASCQSCEASLQRWCPGAPETRDEGRAALCAATRASCSVCEASLDRWCGGP